MRATQYNLAFQRLHAGDLELVRQWRNSEFIRQHMVFREEISPEMHQNWFRSVDNARNFHFVVAYGQEKLGLADCKNLDSDAGSGEFGIYIAQQEYLNSPVPVLAGIFLCDFFFFVLGLEQAFSTIRLDNQRSLDFSARFGAVIVASGPESHRLCYTRQAYLQSAARLWHLARLWSKAEPDIRIMLDEADAAQGLTDLFRERAAHAPHCTVLPGENGCPTYVFSPPRGA